MYRRHTLCIREWIQTPWYLMMLYIAVVIALLCVVPDLMSWPEIGLDLEILFAAANDTGGSGGCSVLGLFPSVPPSAQAVVVPSGVPAPPVPSEGWSGWLQEEGESEAGRGQIRHTGPARTRGGIHGCTGDNTMFVCACLLYSDKCVNAGIIKRRRLVQISDDEDSCGSGGA